MEYKPCPLQLNDISLPEDIQEIIEQIAEDVHETWAQRRMKEGWRYGQDFDRKEKTHPCLVPYDQLPETEKDYDRHTALQTIRCLLHYGYQITKNTAEEGMIL